MALTCLSRTLDPGDYQHLEKELHAVDSAHHERIEQPPYRWERALALYAIGRWRAASGRAFRGPVYDVSAGSGFHSLLGTWTGRSHRELVVIGQDSVGGGHLTDLVVGGTPMADVVTCLSIIEHVTRLDPFLYHLSCLVAPGGLLVLTFAYWNRCGPDSAEDREQRERLLCPKSYNQLRQSFMPLHLTTFGGLDPTYHGAQVHDYSCASLVLEKRR